MKKKKRIVFDFEKIFANEWKELSKNNMLDEENAKKLFNYAAQLVIREIAKVFE